MAAYTGPHETDLEPDDDTMFRFMSWWFERCTVGAVELVWRDPPTGRWDLIRRFDLEDLSAATMFAAETNAIPGKSLYFRPATVRANSFNTTDADVVQIPGAWSDCDEPASVEHMVSVAKPCPSAQIVTGRLPILRSQFYYKFGGDPIAVGELSRQLNRQLHALSGGDGAVVNPSTLMRLPGSIAWPWKPNRQPELTEWCTPVGFGGTYTLADLSAALPPVGAEAPACRVSAGTASSAILNPTRHLLEEIAAGPLWHAPVLKLVAVLVSRGTPAAAILAMSESLTRPGYAVADTRRELSTMIDGAIRKGYAPGDGETASDDTDGDVADVMNVQPSKPATFPLFTDADMASLPDPEWLIPGFLVANTLAPIYGPPSSYKSFLALHSALCLATGHEWFGRQVVQCDTLYIAAEGAAGMKLRLAAWKAHHGIDEIPGFRVVPCAVNLMDAAEARRLILTVVEAEKATGFNPKVVIVDTLHRSMPGADENSSQHMGIAISNCALIQAELKCTLMPVTHTGKDTERGMRGSNSLLGASDAVARVTRTDERVTVTTEKMKDAEDGQVLNLKSLKVNLPPANGSIKPRDSLVLVVDEEPPAKRANKLAPTTDKARQFLADLIAAEGLPLPSGSGFPSPAQGRQMIGVPEKRWREECETRRLSPAAEAKGRNQAFGRAFKELLDAGEVAAREGLVWLAK